MLALNDRQSHLEAMGVRQWYARTKLTGAQSTPDWVLVDSDVAVNESSVSERISSSDLTRSEMKTASAQQTNSAKDILGQLRDPDGRHSSRVEVSSNEDASASIPDQTNLPRLAEGRALDNFSLVLYKANHGLILSESVSGQSHPSEFLLLKNILKSKKALAAVNEGCIFQQQFSWPVFRSLNLQSKQDSELPVLMSSWFMPYCNEDIKSVLYFGSAFPEIGRYYAELVGTKSSTISYNSFKHSLAELLQFPQRKAEVWADICSLYGE